MNRKKIGYIGVIGLMIIALIPFSQSATTRYLNVSEYVYISLNAQEGDVIRGDYRTYNSPFLVGIGWNYLGQVETFTNFYTEGWFEIEILSGSGVIVVVLMNGDFSYMRNGYIEYTITNPKAEAREREAVMRTLIIGVVVGIVATISVSVIAGFIIHSKKKNKRIETFEQKVSETPKNIYCTNCGTKNIDLTHAYYTLCGNILNK